MLAMNDDAVCLEHLGAWIASKPAPTRLCASQLLTGIKKRPRISEAFYFGFNLFNFAASILEKVRT